MKLDAVERYLNSFGGQVIKDAKANLMQAKGDTALGNSIRFKVTADDKGFTTKFYMEDYGTYLDKGVSGNKNPVSYKNYYGNNQSSPYKYTTKGPPIDILSKWIKRKGIKPKGLGRGRSKDTGQYISGFAFLISRKIKREGIKSLSFFQKPLGIYYKELKDKMLKELKLDIETYLTTYYRPK
mgnify:CR=1 FL=1|tara:strand:- start:547 stop:1092 length:546 start_codon:yes stop_codon:yes gene_type:complete